MADNYLEKHMEEYKQKKAEYLRKLKHLPKQKHHLPNDWEDDAL